MIKNTFTKSEIEQAIIVFGPTTFTAKEAFFINFPSVSTDHYADNHTDSSQITRKVIMYYCRLLSFNKAEIHNMSFSFFSQLGL